MQHANEYSGIMVKSNIFNCSLFMRFDFLILNILYNSIYVGLPLAHNAALLVQEYRTKLGLMYNMWVNLREGVQVTLIELKAIYGNRAYAYNNEVII